MASTAAAQDADVLTLNCVSDLEHLASADADEWQPFTCQVVGVFRHFADETFVAATGCDVDASVPDVYDLWVSDGRRSSKVLLSPALNALVQRGQLRRLSVLEVRRCAVRYDELQAFAESFVIFHEVHILAQAPHVLRRGKSQRLEYVHRGHVVDAPAHLGLEDDAPREQGPPPPGYPPGPGAAGAGGAGAGAGAGAAGAAGAGSNGAGPGPGPVAGAGAASKEKAQRETTAFFVPLVGKRGCYFDLYSNSPLAEDPRWSECNRARMMLRGMAAEATVQFAVRFQDIKAGYRQSDAGHLPALVGRVVAKSNALCLARPMERKPFPFQAYLMLSDGIDTVCAVLWLSACCEFYSSIRLGDVVVLTNYKVKPITAYAREFAAATCPLEIAVNSSHPATTVSLLDASVAVPHLPAAGALTEYLQRSELNAQADGSTVNVCGMITRLGRVERERSQGGFFMVYRWLELRDGSSSRLATVLKLYHCSQAHDFYRLRVGMLLACSNVRVCSLPMVTSRSSRHLHVRSTKYSQFVNWLHVPDMLNKPLVGSYAVEELEAWSVSDAARALVPHAPIGGYMAWPRPPSSTAGRGLLDTDVLLPMAQLSDQTIPSLQCYERKIVFVQARIAAIALLRHPGHEEEGAHPNPHPHQPHPQSQPQSQQALDPEYDPLPQSQPQSQPHSQTQQPVTQYSQHMQNNQQQQHVQQHQQQQQRLAVSGVQYTRFERRGSAAQEKRSRTSANGNANAEPIAGAAAAAAADGESAWIGLGAGVQLQDGVPAGVAEPVADQMLPHTLHQHAPSVPGVWLLTLLGLNRSSAVHALVPWPDSPPQQQQQQQPDGPALGGADLLALLRGILPATEAAAAAGVSRRHPTAAAGADAGPGPGADAGPGPANANGEEDNGQHGEEGVAVPESLLRRLQQESFVFVLDLYRPDDRGAEVCINQIVARGPAEAEA